MRTRKKITELFQDSKAGTRKEKIFAAVILLAMAWAVAASFIGKHYANELVRAEDQIQTIMAQKHELQTYIEDTAEHRTRVRFLARNLQVKESVLKGNAISGYVQNYGTTGFGDITLMAIVKDAAGVMHDKTVTVISSDGKPLKRWQRRPFNIVLDIDPGEGAMYSVSIEDVEVVE